MLYKSLRSHPTGVCEEGTITAFQMMTFLLHSMVMVIALLDAFSVLEATVPASLFVFT